MSPRLVVLALAAALSLPGLACAASTPEAGVSVLHCGHLVDTAAGKLLGPTTVVVEAGHIRELQAGMQDGAPYEAAAKAAGTPYRVVDLADATCMPGLIDMHTHLTMQGSPTSYSDQFRLNPADYAIRSTVYARRTLLAGFTTVRNLADGDNESIALRNAINAGIVLGPRIFTAGRAIGSTGGHADPSNGYRMDLGGDPGPNQGIINSAADAWKAVRQHYKDGADVIKIMPGGGVLDEGVNGENPQMTIDEIKAVVAAAHDYGFTVAAHAHGAEAVRRAILGGVDSVEHGTLMDAADMQLMKQHGTWLVPTIITGENVAQLAAKPGYFPPQIARKAAAIGPKSLSNAAAAYKAGIKIAFGTDAGAYPHGENAQEFAYMVKAGMPAMFTLQAATTHAAELLHKSDQLGQIAVGRDADVIAVPGNPLDDITLMQKVSFVMKDGVVYKQGGVAQPFHSSEPQ